MIPQSHSAGQIPGIKEVLARIANPPPAPKYLYARVRITPEDFAQIDKMREEERVWTRRMRKELGMKPIRIQRVLERLAGRYFRRVLRQEMAAVVADLDITRATFPAWGPPPNILGDANWELNKKMFRGEPL